MLAEDLTPRRLSENKLQALMPQPRDADVGVGIPGREQIRIVSTLLKGHANRSFTKLDMSCGVDKIPEKVTTLGGFIPATDGGGQEPIQTTAHQRQL